MIEVLSFELCDNIFSNSGGKVDYVFSFCSFLSNDDCGIGYCLLHLNLVYMSVFQSIHYVQDFILYMTRYFRAYMLIIVQFWKLNKFEKVQFLSFDHKIEVQNSGVMCPNRGEIINCWLPNHS